MPARGRGRGRGGGGRGKNSTPPENSDISMDSDTETETETESENDTGKKGKGKGFKGSFKGFKGGFGKGFVPYQGGGFGGFQQNEVNIANQQKIPECIENAEDPDYKKIISIVGKIDLQYRPMVEEGNFDLDAVDKIPEKDVKLLMQCYARILKDFSKEGYRMMYGAHGGEMGYFSIQPGEQVPSYFANVRDGSIYERKLLSILGLRNLILSGRDVYEQLKKKLFSSDPAAYKGHEGVALMRHVTGNAVDLDTCVLRCSDESVLRTINELNKKDKMKIFNSPDDFGRSVQAKNIAVEAAKPLLTNFCEVLKLDRKKSDKRKVNPTSLNPKKIPVATHNADRGKHPLWQYINVGQNSFHANVPNLPDVVGSLLLAPLHLASAYSKVMTMPETSRETHLADFFEDCVIDACFNLKWKAIEDFHHKLSSLDTIGTLLASVQKDNQAVFSPIYDDESLTEEEQIEKEVGALWRLVSGSRARDVKGDVVRAVTRNDVCSWVASPPSVP